MLRLHLTTQGEGIAEWHGPSEENQKHKQINVLVCECLEEIRFDSNASKRGPLYTEGRSLYLLIFQSFPFRSMKDAIVL